MVTAMFHIMEEIMKISNKLMFAGALACATIMSGSAIPFDPWAPDEPLFISKNAELCYNNLIGRDEIAGLIERHVEAQTNTIKKGCSSSDLSSDPSIGLIHGEYYGFCRDFLRNVLANTMVTRNYGNERDTIKLEDAIKNQRSENDGRFDYFCKRSTVNLSNDKALLESKTSLQDSLCKLAREIFNSPAAKDWFDAAKVVYQRG
jgi:hypothetical protein